MSADLERIALERGDVPAWAHIHSENGDVLPSDAEQLENLFHKIRMYKSDIAIPLRVTSRDLLKSRGVIEDYPVTVKEKLVNLQAKNGINASVKKMLEEAEEVILIFPNNNVRNRVFTRTAEEIRSILDLVLSNLRRMELWTIDGRHVKFLLEDEDYKIPDKKVAYRIISDVI